MTGILLMMVYEGSETTHERRTNDARKERSTIIGREPDVTATSQATGVARPAGRNGRLGPASLG